MVCTECGSNDVRKLSLVFEHGLTLVGARAGAGSTTRARALNVTAVSARAAPPRRKDASVQVALAIGCLLLGFAFHVLWIGAVVFGIAAFISIEWNNREWPALHAAWDAQYMCERCGAVGIPVQHVPQAVLLGDSDAPMRGTNALTPELEAEAGAQKTCPHCRSFIPAAATVCRFCRRDVDVTKALQ